MAKRITQIFQKDIDTGEFDTNTPIKIGSSAQYITIEEGVETPIFLKERLDNIGDPYTLLPNSSQIYDSEQPINKTIVAYLNEVGNSATYSRERIDDKLSTSGGSMSGNIQLPDNNREDGDIEKISSDIVFIDNIFEQTINTYIGPI